MPVAPARTTFSTPFAAFPRRAARPVQGRERGRRGSRSPATCGARTSWESVHLTLWGTATGEGVAMRHEPASRSRRSARRPYRRNGRWAERESVCHRVLTDRIRRLAPALGLELRIDSARSTVTGSVPRGVRVMAASAWEDTMMPVAAPSGLPRVFSPAPARGPCGHAGGVPRAARAGTAATRICSPSSRRAGSRDVEGRHPGRRSKLRAVARSGRAPRWWS